MTTAPTSPIAGMIAEICLGALPPLPSIEASGRHGSRAADRLCKDLDIQRSRTRQRGSSRAVVLRLSSVERSRLLHRAITS
jgi:hypothetical protein